MLTIIASISGAVAAVLLAWLSLCALYTNVIRHQKKEHRGCAQARNVLEL
jgi:hypothetical protein